MTDIACLVCDTSPASWTWTDRHGVAQCTTCGAPYRLLHYEGEGDKRERVEKPPECLCSAVDSAMMRLCWADTKARFSTVGMGLSFPGGYDIATADEYRRVGEWYKEHM